MPTRPVRSALPALLAVGILVLSGCGTGTATDAGARANRQAGQADRQAELRENAGPGANAVDLSFTAETIDGKRFDGQSLAGKPALLWFWAPWCPTCAAQSPQIEHIAKQLDGKLAVVGVSGQDKRSAMKEFVARANLTFPNIADVDGSVWKRFSVTAQSTFVLLDSNSEVVADGYLDPDELTQRVAELAAG